jgi:hypothetical protein
MEQLVGLKLELVLVEFILWLDNNGC